MKQCKPSPLTYLITWTVIVFFGVPPLLFLFYGADWLRSYPLSTLWVYRLVSIPFIAMAVYLLYRFVYLGPIRVQYDDYVLFFHLSRKEQRKVRWSDIGKTVQMVRLPNGVQFQFADQKTIAITQPLKGFSEFWQTLVTKGLLEQTPFADVSEEQLNQQLSQVFPDFFAKPQVKSPPADMGPCTICSNCQGTGVQTKIRTHGTIRTICKTCGGTGYLPRD